MNLLKKKKKKKKKEFLYFHCKTDSKNVLQLIYTKLSISFFDGNTNYIEGKRTQLVM